MRLASLGQGQSRVKDPTTLLFLIMDPVSRNLDSEPVDVDDGNGPMADLKSQLGALQIGGGRDMLIDDYDVVDEKPDVATINPNDSVQEPEPEPLADDCRSPWRRAPSDHTHIFV